MSSAELDDVPSDTLIEAASVATERLLSSLTDLTNAGSRRSSLLPGWSVAHVLSHLARQAQGNTRVLEAAQRGDVTENYPGGLTVRDSEIELGADRSADELVHDVMEWSARLEGAWRSTTDQVWRTGSGRSLVGDMPVAHLVWGRMREVEVHHFDLAIGYGCEDWPAEFVRGELVRLLDDLPGRLPRAATVMLQDADTGDTLYASGSSKVEPTVVAGSVRQIAAWLMGRFHNPSWPHLDRRWLGVPGHTGRSS